MARKSDTQTVSVAGQRLRLTNPDKVIYPSTGTTKAEVIAYYMMEMTPADSAYILLRGSVEVRKSGEFCRTLGPGDVFGEIALVDHRLRSASIFASSDVTALRLDGTVLEALLDRSPAFAGALRSSADSRLAAF